MAEKKSPRTFTTLPSAAIADTSLTALDIRCLAAIALHDGMSGPKGTGGGCYARNATLAALVRTDATNFSKSLTKLVRAGYVAREPQVMDKRKFTLRVQYPADDSWRVDQVSLPEVVGELTNKRAEIVGEETSQPPEIVGEAEQGNGSSLRATGEHYIPLKGELDLEESIELNSTKWPASKVAKLFPQKDTAKAGLGRKSLRALMSPRFDELDCAAQVCQIERAFITLEHDADQLNAHERQEISSLLYGIFDCYGEQGFGQQALRLYEAIAVHRVRDSAAHTACHAVGTSDEQSRDDNRAMAQNGHIPADPVILAPTAPEIGDDEAKDCEQCGTSFSMPTKSNRLKRFCSERCRRSAEKRRAYNRGRVERDDMGTPLFDEFAI